MKTIESLLRYQPTDEDYQAVLDILEKLFAAKFDEGTYVLNEVDVEHHGHIFQFHILSSDMEDDAFRDLFYKAQTKHLDYKELQERLYQDITSGRVFELGDVKLVEDVFLLTPLNMSMANGTIDLSFSTLLPEEELDEDAEG